VSHVSLDPSIRAQKVLIAVPPRKRRWGEKRKIHITCYINHTDRVEGKENIKGERRKSEVRRVRYVTRDKYIKAKKGSILAYHGREKIP
jgi:hypothetical protein